jgi:hypothetical protein
MPAVLTNSATTRFMATLFLFILLVGAAAIAGIEIVQGKPLNTYAIALLSGGVTYSLTLLGVHLGNGNQQGANTQ